MLRNIRDLEREDVAVRALTLHQPWASLVANGAKHIETRSWGTAYRGWMLIHASAKTYQDDLRHDATLHIETLEAVRSCEETVYGIPILPHGAIVAVGHLSACVQHEGVICTAHSTEEMLEFFALLAARDDDASSRNGVSARSGENKSFSESVCLTSREEVFGNYAPRRFAWLLTDVVRLWSPIPVRGFQRLWKPSRETLRAVLEQVERDR